MDIKKICVSPSSSLYVLAVISNPIRFKSRYHLYQQFVKHAEDAGAIVYTVEQAFGQRDFEITDANNPHHIRVRTDHELWHKENLINIGISRLPPEAQYIAWVDADISFVRPDWVEETVHQLQHHWFVQMFSHATDMGPRHQPLQLHHGFVYSWYNNNLETPPGVPGEYYTVADAGLHKWHPGFAWAAHREALDHVGQLIDWAILGSADRHMACALIGKARVSLYPNMSASCPEYVERLIEWEARCTRYIKHDVGYVEGMVLHYWHGKKKDRGYVDRWKVLVDNKFNPNTDVKYDSQGLLQLSDTNLGLRDGIRKYLRGRNEDSIDL
jgi:hypothetical protein